MKNLKLITISISLILLTGCGFKIIDKRELLNFNIKEIKSLINYNWIRTILWSFKLLVIIFLYYEKF